MRRLFCAAWPDDATAAALAAWSLPDVPRVHVTDLHLTLHFLGTVGLDVPLLLAALNDLPTVAFGIRLDRQEYWPVAGVHVATPSEVPSPLRDLHRTLGQRLAALLPGGLPANEREFRPHVSLSRRTANGQSGVRRAPVSVDFRIDSVTLAMTLGLGPTTPDSRYVRLGSSVPRAMLGID